MRASIDRVMRGSQRASGGRFAALVEDPRLLGYMGLKNWLLGRLGAADEEAIRRCTTKHQLIKIYDRHCAELQPTPPPPAQSSSAGGKGKGKGKGPPPLSQLPLMDATVAAASTAEQMEMLSAAGKLVNGGLADHELQQQLRQRAERLQDERRELEEGAREDKARRRARGVSKKKEEHRRAVELSREEAMASLLMFDEMYSSSEQLLEQLARLAEGLDGQAAALAKERYDDFAQLQETIRRTMIDPIFERERILKEWIRELEPNERKLKKTNARNGKLRKALDKEQAKSIDLNRSVNALEAMLRALDRGSRETDDDALNELQSKLEAAQVDIDGLKEQLRIKRAECEGLHKIALASVRLSSGQHYEQEWKDAVAESELLRERLADRTAECEAQAEQLKEFKGLEQLKNRLRQELASMSGHVEQLEEQLAKALDELDSMRQAGADERNKLEEECELLRGQLREQAAEFERLRLKQEAEANTVCLGLRSDLAAKEAQNEAQARQLAKALAELVDHDSTSCGGVSESDRREGAAGAGEWHVPVAAGHM